MIQRFYVHNFRCLDNFDLPVANKSTALLIGYNGTGKSTVGYALEVLQRIARGVTQTDELVTPVDFTRGRADAPMRFELAVVIDGARYEYVIAFDFPVGFKKLRVREESLSVDGKPVYSRELAEVHLARAAATQSATFRIDWHLVALPIVQEQSSADPISIFKIWLSRMLILRPIPALISGESDQESFEPNPAVTNFGAWFSGILKYSPSAYTLINDYLKQIMPDLKEIKNVPTGGDSRSLIVEFSNETGLASIPFKYLSDGEKCFMICSLVLAANKVYGPLFCYWDEPDCYLAPHEVGHLVMTLRQAFEATGQFITTSHDAEAIRRFSDENTIVLHRRNHLEPVTTHQLSSLHIKGDLIGALIRGEVEP